MEKSYHIKIKEKDAGAYAILTGDPARVPEIAKYLDGAVKAGQNREYTTYSGTLCGERVVVMSVGIGGPSMAIGVEELAKLGVKTFIRVGTSGGINLDVKSGDLVIPTAAVRQEGTSSEYLPYQFPAASDFFVTSALYAAAEKNMQKAHIGIVQSKDSFFGELEPSRQPIRERLLELWEIYKRTGVLASEMECAALFTLGTVLHLRTGAVLLSIWNEERNKEFGDDSECHDVARMYKVAVDALKLIIEKDKRNCR